MWRNLRAIMMDSIRLRNFFWVLGFGLAFASCKKDEKKPVPQPAPDLPKKGTISIFAGNGQPGTASGKNAASFTGAWGIVMDKSGNLFVSDYYTTLIQKVTPDGTVSTFAGNTTGVNSGNAKSIDGTGTNASFTSPAGMAISNTGDIYVADNTVIRKITPAGVVSTVAGSNYLGNSYFVELAFDGAGNIYASDFTNAAVIKITQGGSASIYVKGASLATGFSEPVGLAFDDSGDLFCADVNSSIHEISPDKTISTIAGIPMSAGFVNGPGAEAKFYNPTGILRSKSGDLFVSDYGNQAIREILRDDSVSTVVITDTPPSQNGPYDMVFDPSGNILVADETSVLKVTLK